MVGSGLGFLLGVDDNNLPKTSGKQLCKNLHAEFLSHLWK